MDEIHLFRGRENICKDTFNSLFGKEPNQEEKRQLTYNLLISAAEMECMDKIMVIA
jgi:hypothetical protein